MKPAIAIFDIDGTLRTKVDPWTHLHRHLGTAERGKPIYLSWRAGEISYQRMSELDAALWRGAARDEMMVALDTNPLRAGADRLVAWFRAQGTPCVGISTGLSLFNDVTAKELGLDEVVCNDLVFDGDVCTGEVVVHVEEGTKAAVMKQVLRRYRVDGGDVVAFGDGPADVPMFALATVAVAVFPNAAEVREQADLVIDTEPIDTVIGRFA